MQAPLLESVPNVSVGRDAALVEELVARTRAAAGAAAMQDGSAAVIADVHRDSDHDRSVLTLVGRGEALAAALQELAVACVERLDLHDGRGVHPRVGVLDVLPVVALEQGVGAAAAAHALVERLAQSLGDLGVPAVRYGMDRAGEPIAGAATTGQVRRGGPARLLERLKAGDLELVAGPTALHPTAGATACGVRDVLVAFNVDLDVDDLDLARTIAGRLRASAGGDGSLTDVRALGLRLASRRVAQVSMNLDQPARTSPARALQAVARLAAQEGAGLAAAELVGLAPEATLVPLRYACTMAGVPLLAAASPSLEAAASRLDEGAGR